MGGRFHFDRQDDLEARPSTRVLVGSKALGQTARAGKQVNNSNRLVHDKSTQTNIQPNAGLDAGQDLIFNMPPCIGRFKADAKHASRAQFLTHAERSPEPQSFRDLDRDVGDHRR